MGAAEAFGAKGYADTSVEDVLKAADVSRRTFYRSFRSKEELFEQLYEAASLLFLQSMQNAVTLAKTPDEKMANCIELYLRTPQNTGPIFQVLQLESMRPGTKLYERRQAVLEELIAMMDEGVREELGRPVDPLILRGLIAAHERIALHVFNESPGDEDAIQRAKSAMMQIAAAVLADATDDEN
jgi:AcrR family transcriptional regulator